MSGAAVIKGDGAVLEVHRRRHVVLLRRGGLRHGSRPEIGDARDGIVAAAAEDRDLLAVLQCRRIELDDFLAGHRP